MPIGLTHTSPTGRWPGYEGYWIHGDPGIGRTAPGNARITVSRFHDQPAGYHGLCGATGRLSHNLPRDIQRQRELLGFLHTHPSPGKIQVILEARRETPGRDRAGATRQSGVNPVSYRDGVPTAVHGDFG